MDPKDIDLKQIFSNLDLRPLMQMTAHLLAGQEPEMEEYEVKIRIPKAIVDAFTPICEHLGLSIRDVLSKMASEGFNEQMKAVMGIAGQKQAQKDNPLEGLGVDMPDLTKKLSELDPLISKLNQLKGVFDEIVSIPTANGAGVHQEAGDDSKKGPKDPT